MVQINVHVKLRLKHLNSLKLRLNSIKTIHIFAVSMVMLQILPLILENSPLLCIIAIFLHKIILEI